MTKKFKVDCPWVIDVIPPQWSRGWQRKSRSMQANQRVKGGIRTEPSYIGERKQPDYVGETGLESVPPSVIVLRFKLK
jgi:hypothetical protein